MENGNHPRRTGSNRQKVEKLSLFRKIRKTRNVIPGPEPGAIVQARPKIFRKNFGLKRCNAH
jgi:hypothetical protein